MTLPTTGSISMSQVNAELANPVSQLLSLNDSTVRTLAQKSTGQISMADLRGKSATGTTGQYTSGGPVQAGPVLMYGYDGIGFWGAGVVGSRNSAPQSIGTAGHIIVGAMSDGNSNLSILVSPNSEPVGMSGKICRIRNASGQVLAEIVFGGPNFRFESITNGYYTWNDVIRGMPNLSPAGTGFFVDIV